MSSSDISVALDSPIGASVQTDSFGARIYIEADGCQLTLRFDSLDELERVLDDALHDVILHRQQECLPLNIKPHPNGTALRLAQIPVRGEGL